ncbi:MAG: DUF2029 domain-containing protein [Alphaproteobacteria bacterium]|nr:MAG: DUF2029 domain-containing protein [Alphaproteobacteria bacterium]
MIEAALRNRWRQATRLYAAWPSTTILSGLCLLIAGTVAINLALMALGRSTVLQLLIDWAVQPTTTKGDSWDFMHMAREWLAAHGSGPGLYDDLFFAQHHKFQYAPTSLLVYDAISALGFTPTHALLNSIGHVAITLTALGVGVMAFLMVRRSPAGNAADTRIASYLAIPVGIALTLTFYPVLRAYELGQLQTWINFLFVGAVIAWLVDRRSLAGVLIGLICLMKPQFGLFLLWGLFRREWRFGAALALTGFIGLMLSIALYGFENHLAYIKVLSFLSQHGESFWPNQSVNGLMHRLLTEGPHDFHAESFPDANALVSLATLVTSVALIAFALFFRRGEGENARLADFLLAAVVFTAASPIAWEHHYGILAPAFVALALMFTTTPAYRTHIPVIAAFAAAFFFASSYLPYFRYVPGPLSPVQSYLFFAALGVLAMLRFQAARTAESVESPWSAHAQTVVSLVRRGVRRVSRAVQSRTR